MVFNKKYGRLIMYLAHQKVHITTTALTKGVKSKKNSL